MGGSGKMIHDPTVSILYWPFRSQTPGSVEGSILWSKSRAFRSCLGHLLNPKTGGAVDCQMKQFDKGSHIRPYLGSC